jgi:hypothetical protein
VNVCFSVIILIMSPVFKVTGKPFHLIGLVRM